MSKKIVGHVPKDCKPQKNTSALDNKYIEYKSEGDEQLSIEKYIQNIRPYSCGMIHSVRISRKTEIHLTM